MFVSSTFSRALQVLIRAPTRGSTAPVRVEKCRPPSHGLKQSQACQNGIIS